MSYADNTIRVPSGEVMADMADNELAGLIHDLESGVASCTATIEAKELRGLNSEGVQAARRHYERGLRTARRIQAQRSGKRIDFEPARPVHNFVTAFHSLKAVNRLIGLLQVEHEAVTALLADDEFDEGLSERRWQAVERAHGEVERALREGGMEGMAA